MVGLKMGARYGISIVLLLTFSHRSFEFPIVYNAAEILFLLQLFPNIPSLDSEIKSALVKFITFHCNSAALKLSTWTIRSENEANRVEMEEKRSGFRSITQH